MNTHRCFDNCLGWSIVLLNAILVAIELKFKHKFHKRLRDLEKTMKYSTMGILQWRQKIKVLFTFTHKLELTVDFLLVSWIQYFNHLPRKNMIWNQFYQYSDLNAIFRAAVLTFKAIWLHAWNQHRYFSGSNRESSIKKQHWIGR